MTAAALSCPYCNALVAATAATPTGRIVCPRCGESFLATAATGITVAPPPDHAVTPLLLQAAPPNWPLRLAALSAVVLVVSVLARVVLADYEPARRGLPFMVGLSALGGGAAVWLWFFRRLRSNGAVVGFLLANMVCTLAVALAFALLTEDVRRRHDPRQAPPDEEPSPITTFDRPVAPAQLPALGYLPRDTNLIAALHVRELLREPDGRDFLEPGGWAPVKVALREVREQTGLPPEAIDHVVAGSRPGQMTQFLPFPIPQPFIVVQTRQPYDLRKFPAKLTEGKHEEFRGRPIYRTLPRNGVEGFLWCPTDRIFVLASWFDGSRYEDVRARLPAHPEQRTTGLPEPLRRCLEERVGKGTLVWVAGTNVPRELLKPVLAFVKAAPEAPADLTKIQTFYLGLRFQKDVALVGEFRCADAASARRLQRLLEAQQLPGLGAPRVAGPLPAALTWVPAFAWGPEPLPTTAALVAARRHAEQQTGGAAAHWVSMQLRGTPEQLRQALRR